MTTMLDEALEEAGLQDVAEQAQAGRVLDGEALARLRKADLLLVAGLADRVRGLTRGDEVRILPGADARRERNLVRVEPQVGATGKTGEDAMREVALARLSNGAGVSVGVSIDDLGLELAQTALIFGADVLWGDLSGKRTLPLLEGPDARRREIEGRVRRAGRSVSWVEPPRPQAERRS